MQMAGVTFPDAVMRFVAVFCAFSVFFFVQSPAYAQSPMISGWLAANTQCKGGLPDDPKTQQACKRRDQVGERLKRRGCVYQEEGDWWKCARR